MSGSSTGSSSSKDGGHGDKTIAQIDGEAIDKFNKNLQISLEREARLHRHYEWKGNKIAPFNIEHMPFERQRLDGAGMTAEDRALRRQWLKDQELAPNEPVYIPELYPRNPIRRLLAKPWNGVFGVLKPIVGESYASSGRFFYPQDYYGRQRLICFLLPHEVQSKSMDRQSWLAHSLYQAYTCYGWR